MTSAASYTRILEVDEKRFRWTGYLTGRTPLLARPRLRGAACDISNPFCHP
jgi:hypothetical protein